MAQLAAGTLSSAPNQFSTWFHDLVERVAPDYVVAIARAAYRLLQLTDSSKGSVPVITDYALPFLKDEAVAGKRFLVFDDSVIFGSTMARVRDYLLKRGAHAVCSADVVSTSFLGQGAGSSPSPHSHIPILYRKHIGRAMLKQHHRQLGLEFLGLHEPYNNEFPHIVCGSLRIAGEDIPLATGRLESCNLVRGIFDVTSAQSAARGAHRFSILLREELLGDLSSDGIDVRPCPKLRLAFRLNSGDVCLTPIVHVFLAKSASWGDIRFRGRVQCLWETLTPPADLDDLYSKPAIVRLLTAFASIFIGASVVPRILDCIAPMNGISPSLSLEDLAAVVGPTNAKALGVVFSEVNSQGSLRESSTVRSFRQNTVDLDDPFLLSGLTSLWRDYSYFKPGLGDLLDEALTKIFLSVRRVTDDEQARRENPSATRLDHGLGYAAILRVLDECGVAATADEISVAMDACVDHGLAVPKVIQLGETWVRVFYAGEGEDAQELLQFELQLHRICSEVEKKRTFKALTPYALHKTCVLLKELIATLPITSRYTTFGRIGVLPSTEKDLVKWLSRPSGAFEQSRQGELSVIATRPDYKSAVEADWTPPEIERFQNYFEFVAEARAHLKSDDPLLLLSTCRTHRHTYNAVAHEVHSWLSHDKFDFTDFLDSVVFRGGVLVAPDKNHTLHALYWVLRYIDEAHRKKDIFYNRFEGLKEDLNRAFKKLGGPARRFWEQSILSSGTLRSDMDDEVSHHFDLVDKILQQIHGLTGYVASVLFECTVFNWGEFERIVATHGGTTELLAYKWVLATPTRAFAERYNGSIEGTPWAAHLRMRLPVDIPASLDTRSAWLEAALDSARLARVELTDIIREYCPRYSVLEGELPYLPDATVRRVAFLGIEEQILAEHYVLAVDIVKSTNSPQTDAFKTELIALLDRSKRSGGLYYDTTGNDATPIVSADLGVLLGLARLVRDLGARLMIKGSPFAGTRKAIVRGRVKIQKFPDGRIVVKDAWPGHLLPIAFYLANGADSSLARQLGAINDVLVITQTMEEEVCGLMKSDRSKAVKVVLQEKHFSGPCTVVPLV